MQKLLHAFNKLVFLAPRTAKEVPTIKMLSEHVQEDFIEATHRIRWRTLRHINEDSVTKPLSKSFILAAMWRVAHDVCTGNGFTPMLAQIWDDDTQGYNCLGQAIALGSYLRNCKKCNFTFFLAITPDHATIIIKLRGKLYFCDMEQMKLHLLHGTCIPHLGYQWYERTSEDTFPHNYIIIHDFDHGIINAIIESFAFMKETVGHPVFWEDEDKSVVFLHPRFKLEKEIALVKWKTLQRTYFNDMNEYRRRYYKEYLLECAYIRMLRIQQRLRFKFDAMIRKAYERSMEDKYSNKKHRQFMEENYFLLQALGNKVIAYLENTTDDLQIPTHLLHYLQVIRYVISKDSDLFQFAMEKIKKRIFDQSNVSIS